jgi:hypothetical protein
MNKALVGLIIGGGLVYAAMQSGQPQKDVHVASAATAAPTVSAPPMSSSAFVSMMQETGCDSTYSDLKKASIAAPHIGNPAMLTAQISYISDGKVGLKVNQNTLSYDALIAFADPQDTFNLQKGRTITVKFNFTEIGGCILPFTGDGATIL